VTKDILDIIIISKNSIQPRLINPSTNKIYEKFSNALCKCVKASKKNTVERRFLRAVLYNAVSNKSELHYLMSQHQFTFATGNSRTTALHDFTTLCNGGLITKKKVHFCRVDDDVIKKAVEFILSEKNVIASSYGTRNIKLCDNEIINLPKLTRKKSKVDIIRSYMSYTIEDEVNLSKRTMYRMLAYITANDQATLCAIDYVTALLVNETTEVLQNIVDSMISVDDQENATNLILSVSKFLKHHYQDHVRIEDDICYHGLSYALGKTTQDKISTSCKSCKFPFFVCSQLLDLVGASSFQNNDQIDDAKNVISDTSDKFELYMAHVARCSNQSKAISTLEKI